MVAGADTEGSVCRRMPTSGPEEVSSDPALGCNWRGQIQMESLVLLPGQQATLSLTDNSPWATSVILDRDLTEKESCSLTSTYSICHNVWERTIET